jgi:hypothetical protein
MAEILKETVLIYVVGNEKQFGLPAYLIFDFSESEEAGTEPISESAEEEREVLRFLSEKEVLSRGGIDDLECDLGDRWARG